MATQANSVAPKANYQSYRWLLEIRVNRKPTFPRNPTFPAELPQMLAAEWHVAVFRCSPTVPVAAPANRSLIQHEEAGVPPLMVCAWSTANIKRRHFVLFSLSPLFRLVAKFYFLSFLQHPCFVRPTPLAAFRILSFLSLKD